MYSKQNTLKKTQVLQETTFTKMTASVLHSKHFPIMQVYLSLTKRRNWIPFLLNLRWSCNLLVNHKHGEQGYLTAEAWSERVTGLLPLQMLTLGKIPFVNFPLGNQPNAVSRSTSSCPGGHTWVQHSTAHTQPSLRINIAKVSDI